MIQINWKERLHIFFGVNLIEKGFQADEAYVTQLLELGHTGGIEAFVYTLQNTIMHP